MKQRLMISIGLLILVATLFCVSRQQFLQSYLFSILFFFNLSLGALAWRFIHRLTSGAWGPPVSCHIHSTANILPVLVLLFLPLLLGVRTLYPWTSEALQHHQAVWLTVNGFVGRAVLYLGIWLLIWKKQIGAGISLVILFFSVTFASIDWILSFEHEWPSTAYGLVIVSSQGLGAFAFCVAMEMRRSTAIRGHTLLDLGNILFAGTILWSYVSFFQYLVIWMGNLPEEVTYYVRRAHFGWQWIALGLLVLQIGVPVLLLLFRAIKKSTSRLGLIAGLILVMRLLDHFWTVVPGFGRHSSLPMGSDILCLTAFGLIWFGCYLINIQRLPQLGQSL